MTNTEKDILADAIENCIRSEEKITELEFLVSVLGVTVGVLLILLVVILTI